MCCIRPSFFFFYRVACQLVFIMFCHIYLYKNWNTFWCDELALEGTILHLQCVCVCVFIHVPLNLWYAVHPRGGNSKEDEVLGNGAKGFFFFFSSALLLPDPSLLLFLRGNMCKHSRGGQGRPAGRPASTAHKPIRNHMEIAAVPSAVLIFFFFFFHSFPLQWLGQACYPFVYKQSRL